jgi:ferredoxin-NADP reductase
MSWSVAEVVDLRAETASARTLVLQVPDWPGHLAGQHLDVRLTAEDGYSATRSYSISSAAAAAGAGRVELTVERLDEGEVSPYLTLDVRRGDRLEVRGPIGGWFVWRPAGDDPVQLVGGGSGLVPLMAMVRTHAATSSAAPMRLLCSVRTPQAALYAAELTDPPADVHVDWVWTRQAPTGWPGPPRRVDAAALAAATWSPDRAPQVFVCGPTGFVETVADLLVAAGHDPRRVRTERFGPSGGAR